MKKMKKVWALLLALVMVLALAGCGGSAGGSSHSMAATAPAARVESAPMETEDYYDAGWVEKATSLTGDAMEDGTARELAAGRKIIYTAYLELESTDYEETCAQLLSAVKRAGGYVEQSSQSGSAEYGSRRSEYVFRIPSEKYGEFLTSAENAGNAVYKSEDAQDVTSTYVDLEARVLSLETQRDRLLELQAKAETLEDLLTIEDHLTQVQYELESYTGQKKVLEDQIEASTVTVSVREVRILTPTETGFGARLSAAFLSGWRDFGDETQDFVIDLTENLPWIILWGLVIAAVVVWRRKHKGSRPPRPKKEKDPWRKVLKKVSVDENTTQGGGEQG